MIVYVLFTEHSDQYGLLPSEAVGVFSSEEKAKVAESVRYSDVRCFILPFTLDVAEE